MKKFFCVIAVVVFSVGILFSAAESFTFTGMPASPLLPSPLADYGSTASKFQVFKFLSEDPRHTYVQNEIPGTYGSQPGYYLREVVFDDTTKDLYFVQMKLGINIPFFRVSSSLGFLPEQLSFELLLRGYINTVFFASSGTDQLTSDGMYFFGVSLGYSDWIALSFGMEHNSGHYSDEMITKRIDELFLKQYPDEDYPQWWLGSGDRLAEFSRQDPWVLGISVKPIDSLRVYTTGRLPFISYSARPRFQHPTYWKDRAIFEGEAGKYDWYKDYKFTFGVEYEYKFETSGAVYAALDIQLLQSGKVKLVPIAEDDPNILKQPGTLVPMLDKTAPWNFDISVLAGKYLTRPTAPVQVRLEVLYRYGTYPMFNFYAFRGSMISVGLAIER